MSGGAPASTHEQIRRKVLGEAYAFALSVARRPDPPVTTDTVDDCRPRGAGDQPVHHDDRGSVGRVTPAVARGDRRERVTSTTD